MSHKPLTFRPKSRRFKSKEQRDKYFRGVTARTDKKARHNRSLIDLDQRRIEASGYGQPS